MRNKLFCIMMTLVCVGVAFFTEAISNFPRETIVTEVHEEEKAYEPLVWNSISKEDGDYQKTYNEAYQKYYDEAMKKFKEEQEAQENAQKKAYEEFIKGQEQQNMLLQSYNDLPEVFKNLINLGLAANSNNTVVVKDVNLDSNGNLIVKYTDGSSKNKGKISCGGNGTSDQSKDYMKVGYIPSVNSDVFPVSWIATAVEDAEYSNSITINSVELKLKDYDNTLGNPYEYEVSINFDYDANKIFSDTSYKTLDVGTIIINFSYGKGTQIFAPALKMPNISGAGNRTYVTSLRSAYPVINLTGAEYFYGFSANSDPWVD